MLPVAAAVVVEIRTPSESIEQLDAAPGRRDFQSLNVDSFGGSTEVFDWIVAEPDLVFPIAGKLQPDAGWEIRFRRDDQTVLVFVVNAEGTGKEFDVVDSLGLMYRVHTKFDRAETP